IQDEDYWTDITLPLVDEVRRKLRDLVQYTDTATISLTQVTPEGETRLNCGWVHVGDGTMPLSITLDTFTADLIQGTVTVTDLTCTSDAAADTVSGQGWFEL